MKKKLQSVMALLLLAGAVLTASAVKRPTEIHFRHLSEDNNFFPNEMCSVFCNYDSVGHLVQVRFVCIEIMCGTSAQGKMPKGDFDPTRYDTITTNLAWHNNMVTVTGKTPFEHEDFQFSYLLDNDRATQQNGGEYAQRFFYNSAGELSDIIYRYGREDLSLTTFTRENGNVTSIKGQRNSYDQRWIGPWFGGTSNAVMNYSYGNNANPAGIDFLLLETMPFHNMIMTLACIDGKHSTMLPASRTYRKWLSNDPTWPLYEDITQEYTYELDADGYPVKISVPVYEGRTDVVELKYGNHSINVSTGGVTGIEADNASFSVNGRTVSAGDGIAIQAYDLQGRLVVSSGNGSITLPEAGIYILRSGTKTMKTAVK